MHQVSRLYAVEHEKVFVEEGAVFAGDAVDEGDPFVQERAAPKEIN